MTLSDIVIETKIVLKFTNIKSQPETGSYTGELQVYIPLLGGGSGTNAAIEGDTKTEVEKKLKKELKKILKETRRKLLLI